MEPGLPRSTGLGPVGSPPFLALEAFRAGLALDSDHPGPLVGYAEACLRADSFEYPGRAAQAVTLSRRLKELAPRSEAERLAGAERWARRGYWDELRMQAAARAVVGRDTEAQARALADDLRLGIDTPPHGPWTPWTATQPCAPRPSRRCPDRGTLRCASSAGTGRPRGAGRAALTRQAMDVCTVALTVAAGRL